VAMCRSLKERGAVCGLHIPVKQSKLLLQSAGSPYHCRLLTDTP
jgi:hypothetical protein